MESLFASRSTYSFILAGLCDGSAPANKLKTEHPPAKPCFASRCSCRAQLTPLSSTRLARREAPLLWQEKRPKLIINKPKWQNNIISIDLLSKAGCSCETEMLFRVAPSSTALLIEERDSESSLPFFLSTHSDRGCSFTLCAPQKWHCSGTDRDKKDLDFSLLSVLWRLSVTEYNPLQGQLLSW